MSRAYTKEEIKEMFLKDCYNKAKFWANVDDPNMSVEDKCMGVVHSILNIIDGTSGNTDCGFLLIPVTHETDMPYAIEQGRNYFPPQTKEQEDGDIAGDDYLHHDFHRLETEMKNGN